MAQLICNDLTLGYDGHVILEGLSFSVSRGDYLCIVGENGSGKTTLMKTLLGLQAPMKGSITTGDGLNRNEIGYLPQQTAVQRDFPASVREVVISGCLSRSGIRPWYTKEKKRLCADNMEKMGITHLARRCTVNFPAVSSKGCCLPVLFALRVKCFCLTSRFRVLILKLPPKCMSLLKG